MKIDINQIDDGSYTSSAHLALKSANIMQLGSKRTSIKYQQPDQNKIQAQDGKFHEYDENN